MTLRLNQKRPQNIVLIMTLNQVYIFTLKGTGKSWIGLELILRYNEKYPKIIFCGYVSKRVY